MGRICRRVNFGHLAFQRLFHLVELELDCFRIVQDYTKIRISPPSNRKQSLILKQSITGPTLPVLSQNVATDPEKVSWMFTGRAIGLLLGSILAPGLSKACDHMLQLSLSLGIIGICTGVVPILTDFWLLVVIVTLGGVIVGFNDALIQEYFMKQKNSFKLRV